MSNRIYLLFILFLLGSSTSVLAQGFFIRHSYVNEPCATGDNCPGSGCVGWEQTQNIKVGNTTHNLEFFPSGSVRYYNQAFTGISYELICRGDIIETQDVRESSLEGPIGPIRLYNGATALEYTTEMVYRDSARTTVKYISGELGDADTLNIDRSLCFGDRVVVSAGYSLSDPYIEGSYKMDILIGDEDAWGAVTLPDTTKSQHVFTLEEIYAFVDEAYPGVYPTIEDIYDLEIRVRLYRDWLENVKQYLDSRLFKWTKPEATVGFTINALSPNCATQNGRFEIVGWDGADTDYQLFMSPIEGGTWDALAIGGLTTKTFATGTDLIIPDDLANRDKPTGEHEFSGSYLIKIRPYNYSSVEECSYYDTVNLETPSVRVAVNSLTPSVSEFCVAGDTTNLNLVVNKRSDGDSTLEWEWWPPSASRFQFLSTDSLNKNIDVSSPGLYRFRFTIRDRFGCSAQNTTSIRAYEKPPTLTSLTLSSTDVCGNGEETVTLTISPSDANDINDWSSTLTENWQAQLNYAGYYSLSGSGTSYDFPADTAGQYLFRYSIQNHLCPADSKVSDTLFIRDSVQDFVAGAYLDSLGSTPVSGVVCGNEAYLIGGPSYGSWHILSNPGNGVTFQDSGDTVRVMATKNGTYSFVFKAQQASMPLGDCHKQDTLTLTFNLPDNVASPSVLGMSDGVKCDFPTNTLRISGSGLSADYPINNAKWYRIDSLGNKMALGTGSQVILDSSTFSLYKADYQFLYTLQNTTCPSRVLSDTVIASFDPPLPAFTATISSDMPNPSCEVDSATLQLSSSYSIAEYLLTPDLTANWEVKKGGVYATLHSQNDSTIDVDFPFNKYGTYTARWFVSRGACKYQTTKSLYFNSPVTAPDIQMIPPTVCGDTAFIGVNSPVGTPGIGVEIQVSSLATATPNPSASYQYINGVPTYYLFGVTEPGEYTASMRYLDNRSYSSCPDSDSVTAVVTKINVDLNDADASATATTSCTNQLALQGNPSGIAEGYSAWSLLSKPANSQVVFQDETAATTIASVNKPGAYTFIYELGVAGDNNCKPTLDTVTVTYYAFSVDVAVTPTSCAIGSTNGTDDGALRLNTASISPSTGGGISFSWPHDPGNTDSLLTGLSAGVEYEIVLFDSVSGCRDTLVKEVTLLGEFNIDASPLAQFNGEAISCPGEGDGVIEIFVNGGTADYTFELFDDQNNSLSSVTVSYAGMEFGDLFAGDYLVSLEDANGCITWDSVSLLDPALTITQLGVQDRNGYGITCFGDDDGVLNIDISGGNPSPNGYTYLLMSADSVGVIADTLSTYAGRSGSSDQITGLLSGYYRLGIQDSDGCSFEIDEVFGVKEPTAITIDYTDQSDFLGYGLKCNGDESGQFSILASGGTASFTYSLFDAITLQETLLGADQDTVSFDSLPASNNYRIVITDANGCAQEQAFSLTQPSPLLPTLSKTTFYNGADLQCFGDSTGVLQASASGGVSNYHYRLRSNGSLVDFKTGQPGSHDFSNLSSGWYWLVVIDANYCRAITDSVQLIDPDEVVASIQPDQNLQTLRGGFDISCNGLSDGKILLTPGGGTLNDGAYQFSWTGPTGFSSVVEDPTGLAAGNYQVTIQDDNGCSTSKGITLFEPEVLSLTDSTTTMPSCANTQDGTIRLAATGGVPLPGNAYTFTYGLGGTTLGSMKTLSPATFLNQDGRYWIQVRDNNGCIDRGFATIVDDLPLVLSVTDSASVSCYGGNDGSISLSVQNGSPNYVFSLWNPEGSQVDTLSQSSTGLVTFSNLEGNEAQFTYVQVRDSKGCLDSLHLALPQPEPLTINLTKTLLPNCYQEENGSLTVEGMGGVGGYLFSTDSLSFSPGIGDAYTTSGLAGGMNYTFWVRDANFSADQTACTVKETFQLPERQEISLAGTVSNVSCAGGADGQILMNGVTGGAGNPDQWNYQWYRVQDGVQVFSGNPVTGLLAGEYYVLATDSLSCTDSARFEVFEPSEITVQAEVLEITCGLVGLAGKLRVVATGGPSKNYEFSIDGGRWNRATSGVYLFEGLTIGNHTVRARNMGTNCSSSVSVEIALPALSFTIDQQVDPTCAGDKSGWLSVLPDYAGAYEYSLDSGGTFQDSTRFFTNLSAGTYYVTIREKTKPCYQYVEAVTLVDPAPFSVNAYEDYPASCGQANGAVAVSISGGGPFAPPVWTNMAGTPVPPTGLGVGLYQVAVTGPSGCVVVDTTEITLGPDPQWQMEVVQAPGCNEDGGILTISEQVSGVLPYTIAWGHTASAADTLTGLGGGVYTAVVQDFRGCADTLRIVLSDSAIIDVNTQITAATCGQPTGAIQVAASGGVGPYAYQWPAGVTASGNVASNLAPGGYVITVSDQAGCSTTQAAWVNATDGISHVDIQVTPESCDQQNGALAVGTVLRGTAPYTYVWTTAQGDTLGVGTTLSNLTSGNYILAVEDATGCVAGFAAQVGIDLSTISTISQVVMAPDTCAQAKGSLALALNGDLGPYTAVWRDSEDNLFPGSGLVQVGLQAGAYAVSVTNAKGCVIDTVLRVGNMVAPTVSITTSTLATCGVLGNAEATALGGVAPYQVRWSSGEIGTAAMALPAGPAWVAVTDAAGCASDTLHFSMVGSPSVDLALDATTPVTCAGDLGSAKVKVLGGTGPYTLNWGDGQVGPQAIDLISGIHQVSVVDAQGCTDSLEVWVPEESIGVHLLAALAPTCEGGADGQLVVSASNANSPTFTWTTNGMSGSAIAGLASGTYQLSVLDADGCMLDTLFEVPEAPKITARITESIAPTCAGGANGRLSALAQGGNGGFSYAWNTGAAGSRISGIGAGEYSVIVSDVLGCKDTAVATLEDPLPLVISQVVPQAPTCAGDNDGRIELSLANGTGPFLINLSQGGAKVRNGQLLAGTIDVLVQDQLGCTTDTTIGIADPPQLRLDSVVLTDPSCATTADGMAVAYAQGGVGSLTYLWSNGLQGPTIADLGTQAMTLRVVDEQGCAVKRSGMSLQAPDPMHISVLETSPVSCASGADGALEVAVSGGVGPFTYSWSNDSTTRQIQTLAAGSYEVVVQDDKGCTDTATYALQDPQPISVSELTYQPSCVGRADGAARITGVTNALPYLVQWADSVMGDYRADLAAGRHDYTLTDANGCVYTDSVRIADPMPLSVNLTSQAPGCAGESDGSIQVQASGGAGDYVYRWSDGVTGSLRSGLAAGTYQVTVKDRNTCEVSQQETISEFPPLLVSVTEKTSPLCYADTTGVIKLEVLGGDGIYKVSWSDSTVGAERFNLPAGGYRAYVLDGQYCFNQAAITLTQPSKIEFALKPVIEPDCPGDCNGTLSIELAGGTGSKLITWANGAIGASQTGLCADTYTFTATDAVGCIFQGEAIVADPSPLMIRWDSVSAESCVGGDGYLRVSGSGGNPGYTFLWSDGSTGRLRTGLIAGTYVVSLVDATGCMVTDSITIGPAVPLAIDSLVMTEPLCRGQNSGAIAVYPTGGTGNYQYEWSTGARGPILSNVATGFYFLEITSGSCVLQDTIYVTQPSPLRAVIDTAISPACYGDCNGLLALHAQGGVAPYIYSLGNGLMGDTISGLCPGNYVLTLEDANGCMVRTPISMEAPDSLSFEVVYSRDPLCYQDANGIIITEIDGGTEPYAVTWDHGGTGEELRTLYAGDYVGTVIDAAGCTSTVSVTLDNPNPLSIDQIPDSLDVCAGSTIGVDAGIWQSYAWVGPNNFTYDGRLATIQQEGNYRLTVTNLTGCRAEDTFYLTEKEETLAVDLIGPSIARVGDTVAIVDVSYPIPDSVHWTLPWQSMVEVENQSFYQKMVFVDTGRYYLQMDAYRLGCQSSAVLPITILPAGPRGGGEEGAFGAGNSAKSMTVGVYPNPTQGRFTVTIDLPEPERIRIEVLDMVRYAPIWEVESQGGVSYRIPVSLPTSAREGVYLVRIMTPSKTRTIPVILGE